MILREVYKIKIEEHMKIETLLNIAKSYNADYIKVEDDVVILFDYVTPEIIRTEEFVIS